MSPQIIDESAIDPALDASIRGLLSQCFPKDAAHFATTRTWHGSAAAFSAILRDDHAIVGNVGVVDRTIRAGNSSIRVAGVMNVAIAPALRGKGLLQSLMQAAMDEALRRGIQFGLLFCGQKLIHVYQALGWQQIDRQVTRAQDGKNLPLPPDNFTLQIPLATDNFPDGPIHLAGNDW